MSAQSLIEEVKKRSAWSISMGVLTAVLGTFLIISPFMTATITVVLLGWVLILVGIAQFVFALHSLKVGKFFLKVLLSVLFEVVGFFLAFSPIAGVEALTALLGTLLLVQAGLATATAFQVRPIEGWGWFLLDAAASFLIGILILVKWPSSSVWAIGTLVGASVLFGGISRIMIAAKIRSGANSVERGLRAA
ncbi:MAG: HdeD family acid-resistance protein [Candidatus Sulfotelmatobacter sp.]